MVKIFLSSTAKDLGKYCAELARGLNAHSDYKCIWMGDFYASDTTSIEYCQETVQRCDVYVGVIGALYGSCPSGSAISFTQHEYEAAVTKTMPRILFLTGKDFPVPADLREPDEKWAAQKKFRERISNDRMAKFFDDPSELLGLVKNSLILLSEKKFKGSSRRLRGVGSTEKNLGLQVYEMCDREPQEDEFIWFFEDQFKEKPCVPQIYILRGEERENVDSLIERFCKITIEKNLSRTLDLPRERVTVRRVKWPDLESQDPANALSRQLFASVAKKSEKYTDLMPESFAKFSAIASGRILALKHEVRERRWTRKLRMLVADYCRFWDQLAVVDRPIRQILVFISILYPNGTKDSWRALLPTSVTFGPVEQDLIRLQNHRQRDAERKSRMCPIKHLQEICCIRPDDLMEWFAEHGIGKLYERERHCERLFAQRRCIHMAHLEPELERIIIDCQYKGI
jgi:hypothetical protein